MERTLTNEKLIQNYGSPLYTFGSVRFASRTSYETKDLAGALAAMGALLPSSPLLSSTELLPVQIQVADWFYQNGAAAGQGSLLVDSSPLVYAPKKKEMSFLYCLRVSSKFRTAGTTDNFEIAVNPPITTSQDCTAFVSQATIPVTWPTFRANVNNQLLFALQLGAGSPYQIF
jgi:hypothetical protein